MPRQLLSTLLFALASLVPLARLSAAPVNVNTADAATLARELKGIGLKRAQAIVDYRNKNGPFRSPDELALVKGIGPAAIERNRNDLRLDAVKTITKPATPASAAAQSGAPPVRKSGTLAPKRE